jgi:hypothetical protein
MKRSDRLLAAVLIAVCAGCASTGRVPQLAKRSVMVVEVVVETDPPKATIFGNDLRSLGTAPVTKRWEIEKLTWSDGTVRFRLLPKAIALEEGDTFTLEVIAKAEGYAETFESFKVPFSGKSETVTRKVTLKRAGETGR